MTTLVEARAELHRLAERQATLRLRVRCGELVDKWRLLSAAMTIGHRHRDLILAAPIRWGAQIAAEHGLAARALLREFDRILHAELHAIAAEAKARGAGDG